MNLFMLMCPIMPPLQTNTTKQDPDLQLTAEVSVNILLVFTISNQSDTVCLYNSRRIPGKAPCHQSVVN